MKRKFFFLIEKLEIKRSERIAIVILFGCLIVTSSIYAISEPTLNYSPEHYAELEQIFEERSRAAKMEQAQILARYKPADEIQTDEPEFSEADMDTIPPDSSDNKSSRTEKININTASASQLQELPGIGPTYARRIVNWRSENGEFTEVEQLLEIRGIGEVRLETMKPLIDL